MRSFPVDLFLGVIRFTPYWIYHLLAWSITACLYIARKSSRRYAMESLSAAYGDSMSRQEKERISRASFFSLTMGLADLVFFIARPGRAADVFTLEGKEHLQKARDLGKGAVLVIAHFGPFAGMLFKLIFEGFPVRVVMKPPRGRALRDDLISRQDHIAPQPIYSTPVRRCVQACFEALGRNEVVAMPIDQNYGGDGRIFVDFFGKKASTAAGPATFALRAGVPLLVAFAEPSGAGRWHIRVFPIDVDRQAEPRQEIIRLTQKLTSCVEDQARKFPDQWAWMHRRWKTVPKEGELA